MAARAALINMATEIGHFIELLRREDLANVSDSQKATFYKVSADALGALDKYVATYNKPRQDASTFSDDQSFLVHKAFSDLNRLLDTHKLTFSKSLQDQVAGLEDHTYVFAKKAPENFAALLDQIDTKGVFKVKSDASTLSDDESRQFTKDRQDGAGFSESKYHFIAKVLNDTVNTTDDIDGMASIDDDQEVQFFKVIGELTQTQDEFYRLMAFVRAFTDETGFSDTAYSSTHKPFDDMVTGVEDHTYVFSQKAPDNTTELADQHTIFAEKPKFDDYTVSDHSSNEVAKPREDAADFVDSATTLVSKPKADDATVSDQNVATVGKALSDAVAVVDFLDYIRIVVKRDFYDDPELRDLLASHFSKLVAPDEATTTDFQSVFATKSLAELAFWSEMLYRTTNKSLVDTYGVSESKAISAVKPTNDGFSSTDSGSLRSQSYCDFTYIAEDYVGESRTF